MQTTMNTEMERVINVVNTYTSTKNPDYTLDLCDVFPEYYSAIGLLSALYREVAGTEVDERILSNTTGCYKNKFEENVISKEDFAFLVEHFKETTEYIMQNRQAFGLMGYHNNGDLPTYLFEMINTKNISKGSVVYVSDAGYGDFAVKLEGCFVKGFMTNSFMWSLVKIRLFAAGIENDIQLVNVYQNESIIYPAPGTIDFALDVTMGSCDSSVVRIDIDAFQQMLKPGAKFVLFMRDQMLCQSAINNYLLNTCVDQIISLPESLESICGTIWVGLTYVEGSNTKDEEHKVLLADASSFDLNIEPDSVEEPYFAEKHKSVDDMSLQELVEYNKVCISYWQRCNNVLNNVIHTLKKEIQNEESKIWTSVKMTDLDPDVLLPKFYMVARPSLSMSLLHVMVAQERSDTDVSDETLIVSGMNLAENYTDTKIDITKLKNRKQFEERKYAFSGTRHSNYTIITQPCILLSAKTGRVGIVEDIPSQGIAVMKGITILNLLSNITLETAASLLLTDYVKKQIASLSPAISGNVSDNNFLKKIKIFIGLYDDDLEDEIFIEQLQDEQAQADLAEEMLIEQLQDEQAQTDLAEEMLIEQLQDEQVQTDLAEEMLIEQLQDEQVQTDLAEEMLIEQLQDEQAQADFAEEMLIEQLQDEKIQRDCHIVGVQKGMSQKQLNTRILASLRESFQKEREILQTSIEKQREELKKQHDDYEKAVRIRKHALTQTISSLSSMFNTLNIYREKTGMLKNEDIISRVTGKTVEDAFCFILQRITEIEKKVAKIADGTEIWNDYERINVKSFIDRYVDKHSAGWTNFRVTKDWLNITLNTASSKGDVIISSSALTRILDNVLANVITYAFTDSSREDYVLAFSCHITDSNCIVEIKNNGTPITDDIDVSLLKNDGYSSKLNIDGHNGTGCYEIDCIMKEYGTFEIVSLKEGGFTVKYILTFNININE